MLDVSDEAISGFHDAVDRLASFATSTHLLGPNFGVAVAVLLHRKDPARFVIPMTGTATTTSDLQLRVCDPTWSKAPEFLPSTATGPIYKPFTTSFKGNSLQMNNWRNSFDIQAGIGCSAPLAPTHLQSADFIAEHRFDCSFRDRQTGYCHAAGTGALCFNPTKKGGGTRAWSDTSARHRPKLLRRGSDPSGAVGYWSIEPTVDSLVDLLGDPKLRVPAKDFSTVMFGGSPYWSQWSDDISASRLQNLLALDDEHFFALFSGPASITSSDSPLEKAVKQSVGDEAKSRPPRPADGQASHSTDYVPQDTEIVIELASREPDPERRRRLLENATQGHRRVLNVLAERLKAQGFVVREQSGGFDLHAFNDAERHVLFEAKTWTPANLAAQVRSGWAQLEEYAYRNRTVVGDSPELALVLNHEPPADYWAWDWFRSRDAPYVLWIDESQVSTFAHHSEWLDNLMGTAQPAGRPHIIGDRASESTRPPDIGK